jgi:hypothetical protein
MQKKFRNCCGYGSARLAKGVPVRAERGTAEGSAVGGPAWLAASRAGSAAC